MMGWVKCMYVLSRTYCRSAREISGVTGTTTRNSVSSLMSSLMCVVLEMILILTERVGYN